MSSRAKNRALSRAYAGASVRHYNLGITSSLVSVKARQGRVAVMSRGEKNCLLTSLLLNHMDTPGYYSYSRYVPGVRFDLLGGVPV